MSETVPTPDQRIPAELLRVDASARRFETPYADGIVTWRAWGSGEPLLLVYGSHGNWTHWIRNVEALAQERMVIAVDLPGHGDSVLPVDETHDAMSAALSSGLALILQQTGKANVRVDVVGFSFGGAIAANFALRHPELVRRLVLIGVGGIGTPRGKTRIGRIGGLVGEERRQAMKANLLGLMPHSPNTVDDLAMHLLIANAARARIEKPGEFVMPDKLLEVLPELVVPYDAIWGEFDRPHPYPHEQEEVLRRYQPDMELRVIAGAGHWAMYERPEAFNLAMAEILARPVRASGQVAWREPNQEQA